MANTQKERYVLIIWYIKTTCFYEQWTKFIKDQFIKNCFYTHDLAMVNDEASCMLIVVAAWDDIYNYGRSGSQVQALEPAN